MESCLLRILLLCSLYSWTHSIDYCKIICTQGAESYKHTMCEFQESPGPKCVGHKKQPLTDKEKDIIVDKHNNLRRKVANGKETNGNPGPQSSASNMIQLVWDEELAKVAQRWADQCEVGHDKCRKVERFSVGQNFASQSTSASAFLNNMEKQIQMWYDEVKDVMPDTITSFPGSSQGVVGHYTQLVWATSRYVGCGRTFHVTDSSRTTVLLCNYGPAGNMMGSSVYEKGKPCSGCKNATCNDGLCSYGRGSCTASPDLLLPISIMGILFLITKYTDVD